MFGRGQNALEEGEEGRGKKKKKVLKIVKSYMDF